MTKLTLLGKETFCDSSSIIVQNLKNESVEDFRGYYKVISDMHE